MSRMLILILLAFGLLLGGLLSAPAEARGTGDDPYPCKMCWYASPITYHRFKPEDCGEKWRGNLFGARYRFWVVCRQLPNKVWERYVWACPICKDPEPVRKDGGAFQ